MELDHSRAKRESGGDFDRYIQNLQKQNNDTELDSKQAGKALQSWKLNDPGKVSNNNSSGSFGATIAGGVDDILGSQKETHGGKFYAGEFKSMQETWRLLMDESGGFAGPLGILKNIGGSIKDSFISYYEQQSDLLTNINENAGLSGEMSKDFREEITKTSVFANRLGISFSEVSEAMSSILEKSGRFRVMNEETMNSIALTSKIAFKNIEDAAASIESFQNISLGASDAMKAVEKTALNSFQLGLNAKKTTESMVINLDKLNQFGFKGGVDGLNRMVQRSIELKTNLNDVFELADKVMDPTKAIELSANLQVIGGALGDFNDPIKMMYMATNDVEGLQDALIGSVEQLTQFNEETGRFEITGANLRRAKAMAEQLGMSYKDLANTAVNAAQRSSALGDMLSSGLIVDKDLQEFVTNMAQMKNGQMVIEITSKELQEKLGGKTEIALNNMTESQAALLKGYQDEFVKMDQTEIAVQQVNLVKNLERNVSFIAATMRHELLGTDVNKIMEAAGLNINGINSDIRSVADTTTKYIKEGNEWLMSKVFPQTSTPTQKNIQVIEGQYDKNSQPQSDNNKTGGNSKSNQNTSSLQNTQTKHVIDLNIKGDQLFDEFKRWLLKNTDLWGNALNDYLSTNGTK
jgi:methyl-accepting chemotaxis protein